MACANAIDTITGQAENRYMANRLHWLSVREKIAAWPRKLGRQHWGDMDMIRYCKLHNRSLESAKTIFSLLALLFLTLLSGRADAGVQYDPDRMDFAGVPVNSKSGSQVLTIWNNNSYNIEIRRISIDGDFIRSNNCPAILPETQSCTVQVQFQPTVAGKRTGTLTISGFIPQLESSFSQDIPLSGVGLSGELSLSPTQLDFGEIPVNESSDAMAVSVTNNGNAPVTQIAISITDGFSQNNNCTETLDAGKSCTLQVKFQPTSPRNLSGAVEVTGSSAAGALSETVSLSGTGTLAELVVAPASLSFNAVPVNETSAPKQVTLKNAGNAPLLISSLAVQGDFSQTNNCGGQLLAGQQCIVQVKFSPQEVGPLSGSLNITTHLGLTSVPLSGAGEPTEDYVSDILRPYAGDQPSVISTSDVIANACVSGRISQRMQEDCDALVKAAVGGNSSTSTALFEITPERATLANKTTRQGGDTQSRNLGRRMAALRGGATGLSFQGLGMNIKGQSVPIDRLAHQLLSGGQGGGASADSALLGSKLGIFVTGDIAWGGKEETELESGLDFKTYGITAGADYRITNRFILGGAVGYMNQTADLNNNGGDLDSSGYSLSIYGTYYSEKDYFIDFSTTYGKNDFDQTRRLMYQLDGLASVDQEISADYDGDLYGFSIGSGYDFNHGGWTFGPRVDLDYLKSEADGFSEQASSPDADGGGWTTRIDGNDQEWLTLQMGGRVSYARSTTWGVLIPYGRLDWLHEFKDNSQIITGYFMDDPGGNPISIYTDDPDRDYLRLRLGVSAHLQDGVTGFIDYGTILANSQWSGNTISAGFRVEF